jgi:hypothetical protein
VGDRGYLRNRRRTSTSPTVASPISSNAESAARAGAMAQPPPDEPELALTLPVVPPVAPTPAEPGGTAASAPWCPEFVV